MGPRSGRYTQLNEEEDCEGSFAYGPSQNGLLNRQGESEENLILEDDPQQHQGLHSYWANLRGVERILAVVVRFICTGYIQIAVLFLTFFIAGGLGLIAVLLYPVQLDTSLSSFEIPNHKVYEREDAFEVALGHRPSEKSTILPSKRRRREIGVSPYINSNERAHDKWKIDLIYLTKDGGTVFREDIIEHIHEVEKMVEKKPDYGKFCWLKPNIPSYVSYPNPTNYCLPLNSLLTYFYRWEGRTDQMAYSGNVSKALQNAMFLAGSKFYWYVDSSRSSAKASRLLRSQIILGYKLHDYWKYGNTQKEQVSIQHKMAKDYIISFVPYLERLSNDKVRVLFGSPDIYDYQVLQAVYSDIKLSTVALSVIVAFVFVLTSFSPFLTFFCIMSVLLSFLPAYFFYRVAAGVHTFGVLNILSFFIITGIGVDDGFMFINTFRQAPLWMHSDVAVRLHYTLFTAGKATLFTSVTTAGAFFANMASGIPAVHNFGLFMGLVVVMCYLTVLLCMPPALHLWTKHLSHCESSLMKRRRCCRKINERPNSSDDVELLVLDDAMVEEHCRETSNGNANGVVISLSNGVSNELATSSVGVSVVHRELGSTSLQTSVVTDEGCGTVRVLYHIIKRWVVRPVVKYRLVVLLLFLVLLAVFLGLASRLRTADRPPRFFPKNSNLQMFIDVFYNASKQNVECKRCSAFFNRIAPAHIPTTAASAISTPAGSKITRPGTAATSLTAESITHSTQVITSPTEPTTPQAKPTTPDMSPTSLVKQQTPAVQPTRAGLKTPPELTTLTTKPTMPPAVHITTTAPTSPAKQQTPAVQPTKAELKTPSPELTTLTTKPMMPPAVHITTAAPTSPAKQQTPAVQPTKAELKTPSPELTTLTTKPTIPPDVRITTPAKPTTPPVKPTTLQPKPTLPPTKLTTPQRKPTTASARHTVPAGPPVVHPTQPPVHPTIPNPPVVPPTIPNPPVVPPTKKTNEVDLCTTAGACNVPRVDLSNSADIYIVFGIKTIKRNTTVSTRVLNSNSDNSKGVVIYDPAFPNAMNFSSSHPIDKAVVKVLCRICSEAIAPWRKLVSKASGAYECFPRNMDASKILDICGPGPWISNRGNAVQSHYVFNDKSQMKWLAMAFKSTVYKGGSSFDALHDYDKWESFMKEALNNFTNVVAVQSAFQTSEYWKQVFLEVISVISAVYSVALSALFCIIFVAIFTGCPLLTTVAMVTVAGVASLVLGTFTLLGWQLGAVEAISLSILIGTAVDYSVHLVEGYVIAKHHLPNPPPMPSMLRERLQAHIRQSSARASWSLSHVGVSIVSSALTTLFAALPLCFAQVQILARFGQIMFLNTFGSIFLTMTACCAMLCYQPQWRFPGTWRGSLGGVIGVTLFVGCCALILYIIQAYGGMNIPQPDGSSLF